ncbi:MAG: DUF6178 family protein [Armatimonadota bacterium]
MTELLATTHSHPILDALLLAQGEALDRALEAASPAVAAQAVRAAPSLERKTQLLWAMDDRQRREVLELVPAALVGALVQNLEEDNRYLLGDLSREQFQALLSLCSPERQYYWLVTALSFTDARANALPLLLPSRLVAEILLTRPEFEDHVRALGDYPLEEQRIPPEMLTDPAQALVDFFGADNLLRQFPIRDERLAGVIGNILHWDADRYVDILREALRQSDYAENHPLEWETLTEAPVLLDRIEPVGPEAEGETAFSALEEIPLEDSAVAVEGPALDLVPIAAAPLARLTGSLPAVQQRRVRDELQYLYIRQAVAEGGSFLREDLQRVARSVEAYLLLGLEGESGGEEARQPELLAKRPLHKLAMSGARLVERLRQVALRVAPLERVLDAEQRAVIRSLSHPRLTVDSTGEPRLQLLPVGSLPELADLETATRLLHEVGAWTAFARGLGLDATERALKEAGSLTRLLEQVALAGVLYSRLEAGLPEPEDRARFERTYVAGGGRRLPAARLGLRRTATAWARNRGIDPELVTPLLDAALDRLSES